MREKSNKNQSINIEGIRKYLESILWEAQKLKKSINYSDMQLAEISGRLLGAITNFFEDTYP